MNISKESRELRESSKAEPLHSHGGSEDEKDRSMWKEPRLKERERREKFDKREKEKEKTEKFDKKSMNAESEHFVELKKPASKAARLSRESLRPSVPSHPPPPLSHVKRKSSFDGKSSHSSHSFKPKEQLVGGLEKIEKFENLLEKEAKSIIKKETSVILPKAKHNAASLTQSVATKPKVPKQLNNYVSDGDGMLKKKALSPRHHHHSHSKEEVIYFISDYPIPIAAPSFFYEVRHCSGSLDLWIGLVPATSNADINLSSFPNGMLLIRLLSNTHPRLLLSP